MEHIEVKLFSTLRLKLGIGRLLYEGPPLTVDTLLDWINEQIASERKGFDLRNELVFPDGRIKPGTMILIDGRNVLHADGIGTPIAGKTVSIFPPSGGG
jgi:molybdopterin synthase sulfur carrier subunit